MVFIIPVSQRFKSKGRKAACLSEAACQEMESAAEEEEEEEEEEQQICSSFSNLPSLTNRRRLTLITSFQFLW